MFSHKVLGESDRGGSFHLGAGAKFSLNEKFDLQAGVHKYLVNVEDENGDPSFSKLTFNLFSAGLAFNF